MGCLLLVLRGLPALPPAFAIYRQHMTKIDPERKAREGGLEEDPHREREKRGGDLKGIGVDFEFTPQQRGSRYRCTVICEA